MKGSLPAFAWVLIAVGIIFIAGSGLIGRANIASFFNSFFPGSFSTQGFSVRSISLAYPPVQGQDNEWIIHAVLNGWGQSLYGNLDKSDITYSGATAQYPLTITGQIDENKGYYIVDNSNPKVLSKYTVSETHGTIHNYIVYVTVDVPSPCSGAPWKEIDSYYPTGLLGITGNTLIARTCIYQTVVADVAPVNALPNIVPKLSLTVSANGQSSSVVLSSPGVQSLPNGLGSASWDNNPLQGGSAAYLSNGGNYMGLGVRGESSWRVIYKNDFTGAGVDQSFTETENEFVSTVNNLIIGTIPISNLGCSLKGTSQSDIQVASTCLVSAVQNYASKTNAIADNLLKSNVQIFNSQPMYQETAGLKGFWVNLGSVWGTTPELTIRVKSGWIGVFYPQGEPQVLSTTCTPNPFYAGDMLTVSVQTKNIGTNTGSFNIQDLSCGIISQASQVSPQSVPSGGTSTLSMQMVASGSYDECGTCSGKIVDLNSLKSAGWSCSYCVKPPKECVNGQTYVYGDKICTCVNYQINDENCKYCEKGVVTDAFGKYVCSGGPSGWNSFDFMRLLKIIGISIVFTFVMMLLGRFVRQLKPIFGRLSDPKIFAIVVAILSAVFWFAGGSIRSMAIAVVVSAAIIGIVSIFVPFLRSPMMFLMAWIGLSLLLIFIFTIPLASLTASIFGGV
jgi:hypothetical protein